MKKLSYSIILFVMSSGCSSTQPIKQWQENLTKYTMEQGNGDINVLRESAQMRSSRDARPAQIRFDHNDVPAGGLSSRRLDARGIMVGQQVRDGSPVFYFLVGVVERSGMRGHSRLADVRLVSCAVKNGQHHWNVSPPDPQAVARYVVASSAADMGDTSWSRAFPHIDDDFRFEVKDGFARATDARSQAVWQIPVN